MENASSRISCGRDRNVTGIIEGCRLHRRTRGNPRRRQRDLGRTVIISPAVVKGTAANKMLNNKGWRTRLGAGGVRPRAPMADGGHSAVARYLGSAGERFNSRQIARLPAPRCKSFQFVFINLTFRIVRQNFEIATVVSSFLRTGPRGKASLDPSGRLTMPSRFLLSQACGRAAGQRIMLPLLRAGKYPVYS